jgi:hypothetical protein
MTVGTFDYARERRTAGRIGQLNPLGRYGVAEGTHTARCSLVHCANGDTTEVAAVALFLASGERGTGLGVHRAVGSRVRAQMSRRTSTVRASQSTVGCRAPCLWLPAGSCKAVPYAHDPPAKRHSCSTCLSRLSSPSPIHLAQVNHLAKPHDWQYSPDWRRSLSSLWPPRLAKTIHRTLSITSLTPPPPFLISP